MSRIVENLLTKPEKSSKVKLADYTDEELLDELKRRTNEHRKP